MFLLSNASLNLLLILTKALHLDLLVLLLFEAFGHFAQLVLNTELVLGQPLILIL